MEPSYLYEVKDFREAVSLQPQIFKSSTRNLSIFSVPQNNSVGTNDIGNAITIISFPKSKIDYDKYFQNAIDDIGGGGIYLPVISPDLIGFGQVRRFVIYDFKKKIHQKYRIEMSIETYIEKIAIADARQRHFIFEIEAQRRGSNDHWDNDYSLQLIDLSSEKPLLLKKLDIGKALWTTTSDRVFLYTPKTKHLQVLNMNLEPAHHPLEDAIRRNKNNIDFSQIQLHPYLPFAIMSGGNMGSTFICWGKDRNNAPHLLSSRALDFNFSPDGNWVTFKKKFSMDDVKTYLMPVSEKYPHYLGSPIVLSNGDISGNKAAWTTNPTAFVGSSLDEILRWDLTNQPHPNSDRMSFHDYIVERDLEKLGKEKRQGLGETR
jgi:hypothetical protein